MMHYLLSAVLALAQSQPAPARCENAGAETVAPLPSDGPDLGCGRCPAWTIYIPVHAIRVSRLGWRITGTIELAVTRTERRCEQRGSGLFEFFEPDACLVTANLPHGLVLHHRADLCPPVNNV